MRRGILLCPCVNVLAKTDVGKRFGPLENRAPCDTKPREHARSLLGDYLCHLLIP